MSYNDGEVWAAIYCRLSEEDRFKQNAGDDSQSIQNQKSMLTTYAEANHWKIYKIYSDDDFTGADRNRPAFNEMIADAYAKKFQVILCKSQSRFTREMEMVEHYLHDLFPRLGIRFIGLVDNVDTAVAGNKKSRQINGLINEWYLEDLSVNIKKTLTDRREKGYHIGAFCAYGYQKDPERKGHLIPDPEAAEVVHYIFELFVSGMGKMAIARKLNAEAIPNPTEYKRLHGIRWRRNSDTPRSGMWQYFSISDILRNEVYIGNLVQGKYESVSYKTHQNKPRPKEEWIRVENTHEPIIERELWDKAQEILDAKAKSGWTGEIGIFARKARCMYCGYIMASGRTNSCGRYLKCTTHNLNHEACKGAFVSYAYLERVVLEELQQIIERYLDYDAAEQSMSEADGFEMEKKKLEKKITQQHNLLAGAERAVKMLYSDRVNGVISLEEYKRLSKSYEKDIATHQEQISVLQEQLRLTQQEAETRISKKDLLIQFADVTELNFDIVNTLIDYIEVGRRNGHYRKAEVPIVIHWKF